MARARNQPRGHLALLIIAALALLVALCVRVDAAPDPALLDYDDAGDDDGGASTPPVIAAGGTSPFGAVIGAPMNRAMLAPDDGRAIGADLDAARLARARADAPEVAQVVAAAWRAAGVADDPAPSWRLRTRLAALVPWVTVRDGDDASWREVADPTLGHTQVFEVRASWHLDRLLFEPTELRIAALDVGRRRVRQRVATIATRLYFAWLRARAAGSPAASPGASPAASFDAEELAAELDALTDGKFSQMLRNRPESRHP